MSKVEENAKLHAACREAALGARSEEFLAKIREFQAIERQLGVDIKPVVLAERARINREEWAQIARAHGRNDVTGLLETLWAWVAEAGFEYTVERTDAVTRITVSHCPLATMARSLGLGDWGFTCYCSDDASIAEGFNPAIGFSRTRTLMEGHDCCDHCYVEKAL